MVQVHRHHEADTYPAGSGSPGATKVFIIPDIVLLVNGLPLAVIECKEANAFTSKPMFATLQQLMTRRCPAKRSASTVLHQAQFD